VARVSRPASPDKRWLQNRSERLLRSAGIARGQVVLDFGCGEGTYTLPAARVVGAEGRVYAADKDRKKLAVVARTAKRDALRNVAPVHVTGGRRIPLRSGSVDRVLLYDVLHRGYFPEEQQRTDLLRCVRRVLRPEGLLSCYLTHLNKYGMTFKRQLCELRSAGFSLRGEQRKTLLHDGTLTRGRIFSFARAGKRRNR